MGIGPRKPKSSNGASVTLLLVLTFMSRAVVGPLARAQAAAPYDGADHQWAILLVILIIGLPVAYGVFRFIQGFREGLSGSRSARGNVSKPPVDSPSPKPESAGASGDRTGEVSGSGRSELKPDHSAGAPVRAIFLSYRRDDTEGQAGRLYDDLAQAFGDAHVFMDVAGISPGLDFRKVIDKHVSSCAVLLALIGPEWLDAKDNTGNRRLDNPTDFVRLETVAALKRDIPVVPILVRGAQMPRPEQLPEDLKDLAYRNGAELTHARWNSDVDILIKKLKQLIR